MKPAHSLFALLLLALRCVGVAQAVPPAKLTILSYHEVAEGNAALVPQYTVTPTNFVRQLDWLKNNGYHFVSMDQVVADYSGKKPLPDKAVLITFDDGYRSTYTNAYPILKLFNAPAVVALVGKWMEVPENGKVDFGGRSIPRSDLLSWDQLREMTRSGLVEVASHTYAMHEGILANPQGNSEPAATARAWLAKEHRYEDEASYTRRVRDDLVRNNKLLMTRLGKTPRIIVWPYGRYNIETRHIAADLCMPVGLTLDDGPNTADTPLYGLRRSLLDHTLTLPLLAQEIELRNSADEDYLRPLKVMHVDLDYIYDADEKQQEENLGRLLERINAMGVNTVYLQAFADPDANGAADAVYFPNRHLPMRADLFNRVAWQIQSRTQAQHVYAWLPMLAWQLPATNPAAKDVVVTMPNKDTGHVAMGYPRLSPFSPRVRALVRDLYLDLARSTPVDGVLFHDDVTLSDYEDGSPEALKAYKAWGLPASIQDIRASDDLLGRWTILKINELDNFAKELAQVVRDEEPGMKTARNLYASVVLNPRAEVWYSQSLDNSLANYDYTAIMAMPYMEQAADPAAFYKDIVDKVNQHPGAMSRVVMELQSVNWRKDDAPLPGTEMADTIRTLYGLGVQNVGYYPDDVFHDSPDTEQLRPVFKTKPNNPLPIPDIH